MFETARDSLIDIGYNVVKGIISPVSDHYGKKDLVAAEHRLEMCKLAVSTSKWITTDDWECSQDSHTLTVNVLEQFARRPQYADCQIYYLVGTDLAATFADQTIWDPKHVQMLTSGPFKTIVIERHGAKLSKNYEFTMVKSTVQNDISSTKLRELVRAGKSIRYLTPCSVVNYVDTFSLWKTPM